MANVVSLRSHTVNRGRSVLLPLWYEPCPCLAVLTITGGTRSSLATSPGGARHVVDSIMRTARSYCEEVRHPFYALPSRHRLGLSGVLAVVALVIHRRQAVDARTPAAPHGRAPYGRLSMETCGSIPCSPWHGRMPLPLQTCGQRIGWQNGTGQWPGWGMPWRGPSGSPCSAPSRRMLRNRPPCGHERSGSWNVSGNGRRSSR